MPRVIGLDFGTTNSAIAVATADGAAQLASFSADRQSTAMFRSVLYFDPENLEPTGKPRAIGGPEAISQYLQAETKGRLIQSMKSHLGSPLFKQTVIFNYTFTLEELIAMILHELRSAAEKQFGDLGEHVVVGRPAHFSGTETDSEDEAALARLRVALEQAGFSQVEFELEPVAAAYQYEQQLDHDELVLIADFGGGTSDFCLIQLGPTAHARGQRSKDILGTDGVALAGDAFDSSFIRHLVAPHLGLGSQYRTPFGRVLSAPLWIYEKLERWHQLSLLKTRETMESLRQLHFQSLEPRKIEALIHVVNEGLGYQLARAVEGTKCELSERTTGGFTFRDLPVDIAARVERAQFTTWIDSELRVIAGCVDRLLTACGVTSGDVDSVFLTGGSSFVPAVRHIFAERFGESRLRGGEELTTVARGLALRALEQR
ncbi:MAG: Hsp70 family protein [Deltaproteobacteria bacterium]|nr:Hsp70 family protein [Deltaproteobacteria bacterium]